MFWDRLKASNRYNKWKVTGSIPRATPKFATMVWTVFVTKHFNLFITNAFCVLIPEKEIEKISFCHKPQSKLSQFSDFVSEIAIDININRESTSRIYYNIYVGQSSYSECL